MLERWQGIALPETTFFRILLAGRFFPEGECHFYKFLAVSCGFLGKSLFETMIYVCELLTEEPEGGSAMIPLPTFICLYEFLAKLDCSGACPCVITEEDAKELFRPSGLTSSEESSTLDSRLYLVPSEVEEEEEAAAVDVCAFTSSESRSTDSIRVLEDQGTEERRSEAIADEVHKPTPSQRDVSDVQSSEQIQKDEQKIEEHDSDQLSPDHRSTIPDFDFLDADSNDFDKDSYMYYGGEESEKEMVAYEEIDDYQPIGLESILQGICECLEPVRESESVSTPPPPDPFEEFLKRMKQEVEEGRLDTRFQVLGIGPPVSANRITAVALWLADCARRQDGLVGPRNIRHFLCPELEDRINDAYAD
ncbi:uncharacterized protein LOC113463885 [Ceratina calcarata]|uniref:Uncharacterized protein LOC113463885 n=1 Tax=Ceratina calcarata TaxID=156304 RepID=A0AAJ7RW28_9HYME|nr:uncharacterized protein LOC113463885 [Ceratina calcarata]